MVILKIQAISDSIAVDGDASKPASISSAYTGKLSFEYGPFHISWKKAHNKRYTIVQDIKHLIRTDDIHYT